MKEGKGNELSSLPVLLCSALCCRREEDTLKRQPHGTTWQPHGNAVQLMPPQHCVCPPSSPAAGNAASGKVHLPVSLFSSSKFKLFIYDGRTESKKLHSQSLLSSSPATGCRWKDARKESETAERSGMAWEGRRQALRSMGMEAETEELEIASCQNLEQMSKLLDLIIPLLSTDS